MKLLTGTVLERPPGPKYVAALRYAELELREPTPRPQTLARWRAAMPDGFKVSLRAPRASWTSPQGALRLDDSLRRELASLGEAIDALQADVVVIATGPEVTTGQRDRDRLARYFESFPRRAARVVWRPSGLWEAEAVQQTAEQLGALGAFNALNDPVPQRAEVYAELRAEGVIRGFSQAQLEEVVERLRQGGVEEAFVTVSSRKSFREAQLLQSLVDG